MNNITQKLLKYLDCAYTIFTKDTNPEMMEETYLKALAECKGKDWYPVLVIADEDLMYTIADQADKEQLIAGCGDNGKELLDSWYDIEDIDIKEDEEIFHKRMGHKNAVSSYNHFASFMLYGEVQEEEAVLFRIPVKNPWELIAWIPMGGWNECPAPEEMIAIAKYWYERYGAVPAVFRHDMLEFYLEKGVSSDASAVLAAEHVAFCPDRLNQGTKTGTISEIAAGLVDEHVWTFWWD